VENLWVSIVYKIFAKFTCKHYYSHFPSLEYFAVCDIKYSTTVSEINRVEKMVAGDFKVTKCAQKT
jgi:hypothetical protein